MTDYLLFIDTEATGLPRRWNAPYSTPGNWPCCIQVSWVIFYKDGQQVKIENHYINEEDCTISPASYRIHGIDHPFLREHGVKRKKALHRLVNDLRRYRPMVVGHFLRFDYHILSADFFRAGIANPLHDLPAFCTMAATRHLAIHHHTHHLRLGELYHKLFNLHLYNEHNALADASATAECFFELRKTINIAAEVQKQKNTGAVFGTPARRWGCSFPVLLLLACILTIIFL